MHRWNRIRYLVLFLAAATAVTAARAQPAVTLTHVHGLSYSADGKQLMLPSHHGLAVYENGKWAKAPGAQPDYMGFPAPAKPVNSGARPRPGSGMVNPFGVIRSKDGGRNWDKLGLEGGSGFPLRATGADPNAHSVWDPPP